MGYWAFTEALRAPPTQPQAVSLFPQSPQESIPKACVGLEARGSGLDSVPHKLLPMHLFPCLWPSPKLAQLPLPWESPRICCSTPSVESHLRFPWDPGELAGHVGAFLRPAVDVHSCHECLLSTYYVPMYFCLIGFSLKFHVRLELLVSVFYR